MENKKQVGSSSSSSFTNDLFGSIDLTPSLASNGIFSSIFLPQSKVAAKNFSTSELSESLSTGSQSMNAGIQGDMIVNKEGPSTSMSNEEKNSIFQETSEPCPLSSSLYYGGQEDMYIKFSSAHTPESCPNVSFMLKQDCAHTPESCPNYKKDGVTDDPSGNNLHGASRGNWWQGSLYY